MPRTENTTYLSKYIKQELSNSILCIDHGISNPLVNIKLRQQN